MTTTEPGFPSDTGELTLNPKVAPTEPLVIGAGKTAVDQSLPMDTAHPHFDDWATHVGAQSHQGC